MAFFRNAAVAALTTIALSWCGSPLLAQPADDAFKRYDNSIVTSPPAGAKPPAESSIKNSVRQSSTLRLHFGLATRNIGELQNRVTKGERISPAELAAKYSGDPDSAKKLVAWLTRQGFTSIETSADHSSVYATGTVTQIEKSLGVTMKSVTYNGETRPAATTPPVLPKEIAGSVVAIDGLQPWVRAIKHTVPHDAMAKAESAGVAGKLPAAPYKVYDILKAYNAHGLEVAGKGRITGKGQTIAILIDRFPLMSDVKAFWQRNGATTNASQIQLINVRGPSGQLPPPEDEETLDVQWASGIAPGATIRVYAAGSLFYPDLDKALDMILADAQKPGGPQHVSISLGSREDLVSEDELRVQAATFLKLAALGVNTFVSSGDDGSNPSLLGRGRGDESHVEYYASDPWVIAVGGTTLHFDAGSNTVVSEIAWPGSGGGISKKLPQPAWQKSAWTDQQYRLVPDVSSVADNRPGGFVVLNGREVAYGGTSWSAPMWAGFSALIAEAREKAGKAPIGFLAPTLYGLQKGQGFRDIVTGSNGAYKAGPGWDPVTGLGVPDVKALIEAIP
jgi:kumamolisin